MRLRMARHACASGQLVGSTDEGPKNKASSNPNQRPECFFEGEASFYLVALTPTPWACLPQR